MEVQFTITEGSGVLMVITENTTETQLIVNDQSNVAVIIYEGPGQPSVLIDDLEMNVGDTGMDLYSGTLTLPGGWTGKRIRVFRNGTKMKDTHWTRTSTGVTLDLPGDVWVDGEYVSIENY